MIPNPRTQKISNKEIRQLVSLALGQGWTLRPSRGGHIQVIPTDKTKPIVTVSSTPTDNRAVANARGDFRRSGLQGV